MENESKSAIKREVEARQKLAVTLTALSEKQLKQLGLPEKLTASILDYKKLKSNGALRRQAQYLGVLMRDVDPELIQKVMTQLQYRKP